MVVTTPLPPYGRPVHAVHVHAVVARDSSPPRPRSGPRFGDVSYTRARAVNPARPRPRFRAGRLLAAKKRKAKEKGKGRRRGRRRKTIRAGAIPLRETLVRLPARGCAAVLYYPRVAQ